MAGRGAGFIVYPGQGSCLVWLRVGKRATTAVRVRGGGRRCSSLSPRGRGGGSRFLCTATDGKGTFRLFPMRGGGDDFPRAARRGDLSPASSMQLRGGGRRRSSLSPQGGSGGSRFLCTATDGKGTFRLFPMRGGWLTAYRAVNIAAAHWKFARKLARPPSWFHVTWAAVREGFVPTVFRFGRAGVTVGGSSLFSCVPSSSAESGYGGLCPHPPRNLRFLGFSFCCRLFGRKDISP